MGTQTSKPLFGDEERRNRFRRPRTPVNNNNNNSNNNNTCSSPVPPENKRTWPCSNCHATVSNEETKCPYCGGRQVKVKIPRSPLATSRALNSNLLLERLGTPTTPVTRKAIDTSKIQAFLSESATISTMDYDEEDEEVDDEEEEERQEEDNRPPRPASVLSQASSLSQNFNFPRESPQQRQFHSLPSPPFVSTDDRPPDPVAVTLEAAQVRSEAPSPLVVFEKPSPQQPKRKAASGFEAPKKKVLLNDSPSP